MALVRIDDTEDEWRRDVDSGSDSDSVFYPSHGSDDDDSTELSSLVGSASDDSVDGENYFYADDPEVKPDRTVFKRAATVAICAALFVLVLVTISLVLLLVPDARKQSSEEERVEPPYHHNLHVAIPERRCSYDVVAPPGCTAEVNDAIGCQIGCGLVRDDALECGLNVTLTWSEVNVTRHQQWIYLLASVDAENWWQTGFAQPLLTADQTAPRTSGTVEITDGCFGAPYQVVTVVACLSSVHIDKGQHFVKFPKNYCNATYGICVPTNNVALLPSDECDGEDWIGNDFVASWAAPYWSGVAATRPSMEITALVTAAGAVAAAALVLPRGQQRVARRRAGDGVRE